MSVVQASDALRLRRVFELEKERGCDNKAVIRYWARASTIRDDDYSADRIDARDVATDVFHTGWREHLLQRNAHVVE